MRPAGPRLSVKALFQRLEAEEEGGKKVQYMGFFLGVHYIRHMQIIFSFFRLFKNFFFGFAVIIVLRDEYKLIQAVLYCTRFCVSSYMTYSTCAYGTCTTW